MKVLVKSLKNATNSMISAVIPMKLPALNLNSPQFVRKMNINDVLCKNLSLISFLSSIHDGAPNRSARGMLKEMPTSKIRSL